MQFNLMLVPIKPKPPLNPTADKKTHRRSSPQSSFFISSDPVTISATFYEHYHNHSSTFRHCYQFPFSVSVLIHRRCYCSGHRNHHRRLHKLWRNTTSPFVIIRYVFVNSSRVLICYDTVSVPVSLRFCYGWV